MTRINPGDQETRSPDLVSENIEALKSLFPEICVEGKIDFDVLRQLLGANVDDREEKYGLNWHGKRQARQLALTPSTGTLRPCPEESVNWDTTQNLMIEGDNLEVLKLLQKSYPGKIKLIYIDPPYNTGRDFIYQDNFHDNIQNYLRVTGQIDGGGQKLASHTESSGRFHTEWLNMMYPRLRIAHSLLKKDGAIFISISDHEVHSLRLLMNEIYGEENFIAAIIWQKVFSPKNSARHFSEDHDYIVVYAKSAEAWHPKLLPRTEEMEARYSNPDNDSRGPWTSGDLSARNYYGEGTYSVTCPSGRVIDGPPPGRYWMISKEKFEEFDRDNRIWWGSDASNMPRLKRFLSDVQDGRVPQTLWPYSEVGHTQEAKKELISLVEFPNSDIVFETPKPTRLIRRILQVATGAGNDYLNAHASDMNASVSEPDIVLDCFAGTGSTLDALFRQNAEDGGLRRGILVQLPEPIESGGEGLKTVADITKTRLRSAANRLAKHSPMFSGDIGFRVFKLDSTNIRAWDPERANLEQTLLDSLDHVKPGRSEQDILYEILLKLGLDLCVPIETRTIAGKLAHSAGGGVLIACLAESIARQDLESLAHGIADWHSELQPAGKTTCVFRDSAFDDDVTKTNVAAILAQRGIPIVRSL